MGGYEKEEPVGDFPFLEIPRKEDSLNLFHGPESHFHGRCGWIVQEVLHYSLNETVGVFVYVSGGTNRDLHGLEKSYARTT